MIPIVHHFIAAIPRLSISNDQMSYNMVSVERRC